MEWRVDELKLQQPVWSRQPMGGGLGRPPMDGSSKLWWLGGNEMVHTKIQGRKEQQSHKQETQLRKQENSKR